MSKSFGIHDPFCLQHLVMKNSTFMIRATRSESTYIHINTYIHIYRRPNHTNYPLDNLQSAMPDEFLSGAVNPISLSSKVGNTSQKRTTEQGASAKGKVGSTSSGSKTAPGLNLLKRFLNPPSLLALAAQNEKKNSKVKVGNTEIEVNRW